jgi:hypothetical protein
MTHTIAIIGTGRMARRLAEGWLAAEHRVIFGSRNPEDQEELISSLPGAEVATHEDALADADCVVIAIPYERVEEFARHHAERLRDRLVIDITNPFSLQPEDGRAGAQVTADAIGSTRVVAAFKTNFFDTLSAPTDPGTNMFRDVFFAGGNGDDQILVTELIQAMGFRAVNCGGLEHARALDLMTPLIVELDRRYSDGQRQSSYKIL